MKRNLKQRFISRMCGFCNGTGHIWQEEERQICLNCFGLGEVYTEISKEGIEDGSPDPTSR